MQGIASEIIKIIVAVSTAVGGGYILHRFAVKYIESLVTRIEQVKREGDDRRDELKRDVCNKINSLRGDVKELYGRTDRIFVIDEQICSIREDIKEIKNRFNQQ